MTQEEKGETLTQEYASHFINTPENFFKMHSITHQVVHLSKQPEYPFKCARCFSVLTK